MILYTFWTINDKSRGQKCLNTCNHSWFDGLYQVWNSFEPLVNKIHGDSDGAFLCETEILNSRLNEMDFRYKIFRLYFI